MAKKVTKRTILKVGDLVRWSRSGPTAGIFIFRIAKIKSKGSDKFIVAKSGNNKEYGGFQSGLIKRGAELITVHELVVTVDQLQSNIDKLQGGMP